MIHLSGYVVIMAIVTLLCGALQAISLKWMNRERLMVCDDIFSAECSPRHYTQAFFQTAVMFGGESLCLTVYVFEAWRQRRGKLRLHVRQIDDTDLESVEKEIEMTGDGPDDVAAALSRHGSLDSKAAGGLADGTADVGTRQITDDAQILRKDPKCPWWWWITPAPLDFIECALSNVATTITYVSTVQMLHNFSLIASAGFSILVLRRPLRIHEWGSCLVITAALILTSIPALKNPELMTNAHHSTHWFGIFLATLSTCVHSLQQIWEEKLFQKGRMSSIEAVGIEGISGLILSITVLPIVHFFGIEDVTAGFYQARISSAIQAALILYGLSSFGNNLSGVIITKWSNALLRALFSAMRPPIVWAAEMAFGWNDFSWWQVGGMILLGIGLQIHLLIPPFNRRGKMRRLLRYPIACFGYTQPLEDDDDESVTIHADRSSTSADVAMKIPINNPYRDSPATHGGETDEDLELTDDDGLAGGGDATAAGGSLMHHTSVSQVFGTPAPLAAVLHEASGVRQAPVVSSDNNQRRPGGDRSSQPETSDVW